MSSIGAARVPGTPQQRFAAWEEMRLKALTEVGEGAVRRVLKLIDLENYTVVTMVPTTLPPMCTNAAASLRESVLRCIWTTPASPLL